MSDDDIIPIDSTARELTLLERALVVCGVFILDCEYNYESSNPVDDRRQDEGSSGGGAVSRGSKGMATGSGMGTDSGMGIGAGMGAGIGMGMGAM